MRRVSLVVALTCAGLAFISTATEGARQDKKEPGKGTPVLVDGLTSIAPAAWKEEAPANKMRSAQFRLPHHKDDAEDAELVIFKGLGGGAAQNVERWKGQFLPPEGKKIEDMAKVEEIKIAGKPATMLDIQGIYKSKAAPFDPNSKEVRKPEYRMIAVYFDGPENPYQFKLTGPAKTVEMYKKDFDSWVKGFK
jgi:hypothetical protein